MADHSWLEDDDVMKAPDLLAHLQSLIEHPGWAYISRVLDNQAEYRLNAIVTNPLKGLDAALEQEYMKGEAAQLLTLRGLPTVLIEELTAAVKELRDASRRDEPVESSEPGSEWTGHLND
jgi:hypothetical protein